MTEEDIHIEASNAEPQKTPDGSRKGWKKPLVLILFGVVMGWLFPVARSCDGARGTAGDGKIGEVTGLIASRYVDSIAADSLQDDAVHALMAALDPHSCYITKAEVEHEMNDMHGSFEGVGLMVKQLNDTVFVGSVIEDGPSTGLDILAGDCIVAVDTVNVIGLAVDKVVELLHGPGGTKVGITLQRYGESGTRRVEVTRGMVPTPSLACCCMMNDSLGYIRLTRFSETSYQEFCKALTSLKAKGMTALILDLRDNGGGLLEAAIGIVDELLPGRNPILYSQGAHRKRRMVYSSWGGLFGEGRLVVLVDEFSASASEIVAGAVQDNDRGLVVGRRTFGKGLVQEQIELSDGSLLRLTTARYYTPSGRCIQRPYGDGNNTYYSDFYTRVVDEVLTDSALVSITDSTPYYTLVKHRTVYGGGGVYPDRRIPYKKDPRVAYYNAVLDKGLPARFGFRYVTSHVQELLKAYPDEESFVKGFAVSDAMFGEFLRAADRAGVQRNATGIAAYKKEMCTYIKAYIAQSLYGTKAFCRIALDNDSDVEQTIKIMGEL